MSAAGSLTDPDLPPWDASSVELWAALSLIAADRAQIQSRFASLAVDNATANAALRKVMEFVRDVATNWDHDEDAHKYGTLCRVCEAEELLA